MTHPGTPGWNAPFINQRLEDLTFMADTGESAEGAAERLGISHDALEIWTRRHAPELWKRLVARDPRDRNSPQYRGHTRRTA